MAQKRKEITNHREIERIVYIHEQIADQRYPTASKLAKALECSVSSINRDLEFLRDRCYAPIEYDMQKRGYHYTDANYKLNFTADQKAAKAEIAGEKKSFAEYFNLPISLLDKLEEITNLGLQGQTKLQANLSCKYIGRNYFDGCTWLGLKAFDFCKKPQLTLAYFEPIKMAPKEVSFHLQGVKQNYISEFSAVDKGYWHYIIVPKNLLKTKTEVARMELKNLIDFTRIN